MSFIQWLSLRVARWLVSPRGALVVFSRREVWISPYFPLNIPSSFLILSGGSFFPQLQRLLGVQSCPADGHLAAPVSRESRERGFPKQRFHFS